MKTKNKYAWTRIVSILILALGLSAGGGPVTEAPTKEVQVTKTQAPTEAPVATKAPSEETAGTVSSPAEVRVAVVPGGPHP